MSKVNGYKIELYADLRDADLRYANLRDADLRCADLRGADLRGVDLTGANLRDADLRCANLRGADLEEAYLVRARLKGACLKGAYLRGAIFINWKINPQWSLAFIGVDICQIGCKEKPISEWNDWFKNSDEEFETKRDTKQFKAIYLNYRWARFVYHCSKLEAYCE